MKMHLRTILNTLTTEWFSVMTPQQNAINKLIYELDEVAIRYETVWGVYKLESLAPDALMDKVQAQVVKLTDAIQQQDEFAVAELVQGCKRMYDALEKNAVALGHKPLDPEHWEIKVGSKIYRIVKTVSDARSLHKPDGSGITILTLEELILAYNSSHSDFLRVAGGSVHKAQEIASGKNVAQINWKEGDTIPF